MRLFHPGTFLILLHLSLAAPAADIAGLAPPESDGYVWVQMNEKSGLVSALPAVTAARLIEQMGEMHSDLQARKVEIARTAEARKFTAKDGLITAIMPGGLLYAAAVQQRHHQAIARLNEVTTQLDELSRDLAEFRAATFRRILVASAQ